MKTETDNTTTKNNAIIAEFMGYELEETLGGDNVYYIWNLDKTEKFFEPENLRFHNDWNWLMTVVDMIENRISLLENDNSFNVTVGSTCYCVIQDSNGEVIEITGEGRNKIMSVYKAVVDFIVWYNKEVKN